MRIRTQSTLRHERLLPYLLICSCAAAFAPSVQAAEKVSPAAVLARKAQESRLSVPADRRKTTLDAATKSRAALLRANHHECPGGTPHVQGLACGETTSGALANTDCVFTDGSYYDVYGFAGSSGQTVTIDMSSTAFDPFLLLYNPSGGQPVAFNDDRDLTTTDSRIVYTLNVTGTWFIGANSFDTGRFGAYTLTLTCSGGPAPTATPTATTTPTIPPTPLLTPTNAPTAIPVISDPSCGTSSVLACPASSVVARLTTADCPFGDGSFFDSFRFSGTAGQTVVVSMSSGDFDTFLVLADPEGTFVAFDDDSGGGLNSRLFFTLPSTGVWTVLANSFDPNQFGQYTLSLNCGGGLGNTATPLPGMVTPPSAIPTLSLSGIAALSLALAAAAIAVIRRA